MHTIIKKTSTAILAVLVLMLLAASPAWAVPSLQLYIKGAEYNNSTESWMSYDNPFTLLVAGSNQGNAATLTDLKLHIGVPTDTPDTWSGPTNWLLKPQGEVKIKGSMVDQNDNSLTQEILIFEQDNTSHGVPQELAGEGTPEPWPGYYQSVRLPDMNFSSGDNLDAIPNFDPEYDPEIEGSGKGFIYEYVISYQKGHLFGVHLDVTGLQTKNNGITKQVFAPYSHNADAPTVPEPTTILLFGSGLLVLAWVGRRQLQRRKDA